MVMNPTLIVVDNVKDVQLVQAAMQMMIVKPRIGNVENVLVNHVHLVLYVILF